MSEILSIARQAPAIHVPADDIAEQAIARLLDGHDLDRTMARELFERIVEGSLSEPLMAATFVALRVRGETAEELIAALDEGEERLGPERRWHGRGRWGTRAAWGARARAFFARRGTRVAAGIVTLAALAGAAYGGKGIA